MSFQHHIHFDKVVSKCHLVCCVKKKKKDKKIIEEILQLRVEVRRSLVQQQY